MIPAQFQLVRLIYKSHSALTGGGSDVERGFHAILETSQRLNAAEGVTGALLFTRLLFVQALEGPANVIENTFDRICCDLRHTDLELLEYAPVHTRAFAEWSMNHLTPGREIQAVLDESGSDEELADAAAAALKLMAALLRASGPLQDGARSPDESFCASSAANLKVSADDGSSEGLMQ